GRRPATAVPTQALFLLNSPLLKDASQALAARLLADPSSNEHTRLSNLWLRVLNRPIVPDELHSAVAFLDATRRQVGRAGAHAGREHLAWARLCHALLISNEFLFRF